jgi:hypothetical protein
VGGVSPSVLAADVTAGFASDDKRVAERNLDFDLQFEVPAAVLGAGDEFISVVL